MPSSCPSCGTPLAVVVAPPATAVDQVEMVNITGPATAREVARVMAGRPPTPSDVERARRLLNRAVRTGRLQVSAVPRSGGQTKAVYTVAG